MRLSMGICRSCFHSLADDSASNERSPLHSTKTSALRQQDRAATAWSQWPAREEGGRATDAQSQELITLTCEGRTSSSSVKIVDHPHDGGYSDSAPSASAADSHAPLSLSAVNKANYHQLGVMLGVDSVDARRLIDARHATKGFGTLDALLTVSGITLDGRRKIEQKLCMHVGCVQVRCSSRITEGTVSGVMQGTQFVEGESLLRVATWNLQQFTDVKAASQPLVEAVCDVIVSSR